MFSENQQLCTFASERPQLKEGVSGHSQPWRPHARAPGGGAGQKRSFFPVFKGSEIQNNVKIFPNL